MLHSACFRRGLPALGHDGNTDIACAHPHRTCMHMYTPATCTQPHVQTTLHTHFTCTVHTPTSHVCANTPCTHIHTLHIHVYMLHTYTAHTCPTVAVHCTVGNAGCVKCRWHIVRLEERTCPGTHVMCLGQCEHQPQPLFQTGRAWLSADCVPVSWGSVRVLCRVPTWCSPRHQDERSRHRGQQGSLTS